MLFLIVHMIGKMEILSLWFTTEISDGMFQNLECYYTTGCSTWMICTLGSEK